MAEKLKEKLVKEVLVTLENSKSSDNASDFALDLAEKYTAGALFFRETSMRSMDNKVTDKATWPSGDR
ncbi:hypothetical protein GWO13_04260 [Candidatus Bathyarchaeota archaeon]|nr:hypothetical protein [Candidatus Bathyarchaeota archaeon]